MLVVGSQNPHKVAEIESMLEGIPVVVVGADILPRGPAVEESGSTFSANVGAKAREYAARAAALEGSSRPLWVVADDSGLCVNALGGDPGVCSARYAGENRSYADNNRKLLQAMRGVPADRRQARFVCAIACARVPSAPSSEPELLFEIEGTCEGTIAEEEIGSNGFGYDPIFVDPTSGLTFAQMESDEKNRLSHRGNALRQFRKRFLKVFELNQNPP